MHPPATLKRLIESAAQRVTRLEQQHERAQRKATRTGDGPDHCYALVLESKLDDARSHLNALRLQAKREARDAELLTRQITTNGGTLINE